MNDARYQLVVRQLRGDDLDMNRTSGYMPRPSALMKSVSFVAARIRDGFQMVNMVSQDYALLKRGDAEIEVKLEREVGT